MELKPQSVIYEGSLVGADLIIERLYQPDFTEETAERILQLQEIAEATQLQQKRLPVTPRDVQGLLVNDYPRNGHGQWVARHLEDDNTLLGHVWVKNFRDDVHLARISVLPAFWRQGIGTKLLHTAFSYGECPPDGDVTLNVNPANPVQAWYKGLGFRRNREGVAGGFSQYRTYEGLTVAGLVKALGQRID